MKIMTIPEIIEKLYENNIDLKKPENISQIRFNKLIKKRGDLVLRLGGYFFSNFNLKLIIETEGEEKQNGKK